MKRLIIRADDFGISEAVTLGCLSAVRYGIVTSMGMIVNMEHSRMAAELVREEPGLCLGLHLNFIVGRPCARPKEVKGMLAEDGSFISSCVRRRQVLNSEDPFDYEEILAETEAQIQRFYELNGRYPDYMDSHSVTTPSMERAVMKMAMEYGITKVPIRGNTNVPWKRLGLHPTQYEFYAANQPFSRYLEEDTMKLEEGELGLLVMHPGFLDQKIMDISSMTLERMKDHDFLVSWEVKQWLKNHQITLVSFQEV